MMAKRAEDGSTGQPGGTPPHGVRDVAVASSLALDPTVEARLRLEEVYREEVRKSLDLPLTRGERFWGFLNSAVGIWLLTSVAVGAITWSIAEWRSRSAAAEERTDERDKLDREIASRLRVAHQSLALIAKGTPETKPFGAFMLGQSIGGFASPLGDSNVFAEFRGRSLLSLVTQLERLLSDEEQLQLQTALVDAEVLNGTLTEMQLAGFGSSNFGSLDSSNLSDEVLQKAGYGVAALLRHPRWSSGSTADRNREVGQRHDNILASILRKRDLVDEYGLFTDLHQPSNAPYSAFPSSRHPRAAPVQSDPGPVPRTAPASYLDSLQATTEIYPSANVEEATVAVTVRNGGTQELLEGEVLLALYSTSRDVVFVGRANIEALRQGASVRLNVKFDNVLSSFSRTATEARPQLDAVTMRMREARFADGTVWPAPVIPYVPPPKNSDGTSAVPPDSGGKACGAGGQSCK